MRKYLSQLWIMLLLMLVSINSFAADPLWQVLPDSIEKVKVIHGNIKRLNCLMI